MTLRVTLVALLVVTALQSRPAWAGPSATLPAHVRVNVSGLGIGRALVSSTAGLIATAPDGTVLYRGASPTRAAIEVTRTSAAGPRTVPFEFSVLDGAAEGSGRPLLVADALVPIRFAAEAGLLMLDGRTYRGTLELARDDDGAMIVVNEVATSDYLASVVGAEVPYTWEPAALAAQAIAARTYLLTHLGRHGSYDLEGDTRDQAYGGVESEAPATIRAVGRTAGIVATYRGTAISALYSANMGGATENSEDVFVSALPYLRSVGSPWDAAALISDWGRPGYVWSRELTPSQLQTELASRGITVGEPQRIDIVATASSGRVTLARVSGTAGTRVIGKDLARYYFGLRSSLFTVVRAPDGERESVAAADAARLRDLNALGADLAASYYRRVAGPDRELVDLQLTSYDYVLPERFVFSGRGYGHGVGLSQWGAQGMALAGYGYEDILKHYYTGIDLTQVGGG